MRSNVYAHWAQHHVDMCVCACNCRWMCAHVYWASIQACMPSCMHVLCPRFCSVGCVGACRVCVCVFLRACADAGMLGCRAVGVRTSCASASVLCVLVACMCVHVGAHACVMRTCVYVSESRSPSVLNDISS